MAVDHCHERAVQVLGAKGNGGLILNDVLFVGKCPQFATAVPAGFTSGQQKGLMDMSLSSFHLTDGLSEEDSVVAAPTDLAESKRKLDRILKSIARRGNHRELSVAELAASPLGQSIQKKVALQERLIFVLPAFPAKSSNREKTFGPNPDLGELLGLENLHRMTQEIGRHHKPGAEVVICSDGRVFNDLVMVSDEDLDIYSQRMSEIIQCRGFFGLRMFSLDDCSEEFRQDAIREELVDRFGPRLDEIRASVKQRDDRRTMFNGIHRFMKEDLAYHSPELSNSQLSAYSKRLAYQVMQRSQAWDNFLATRFADTLRLSIHPYPISSKKFGIRLVPTADHWATPWHNVVVQQQGVVRLVKRREAIALGGSVRMHDGEFAYYEVR